ncbi:MAG: hypothetical protein UV51_C0010G0001, partial [Candidatus Woesebacteria bacterium GW2011_GWC1_42_9]
MVFFAVADGLLLAYKIETPTGRNPGKIKTS